jgi:hypothetical protein
MLTVNIGFRKIFKKLSSLDHIINHNQLRTKFLWNFANNLGGLPLSLILTFRLALLTITTIRWNDQVNIWNFDNVLRITLTLFQLRRVLVLIPVVFFFGCSSWYSWIRLINFDVIDFHFILSILKIHFMRFFQSEIFLTKWRLHKMLRWLRGTRLISTGNLRGHVKQDYQHKDSISISISILTSISMVDVSEILSEMRRLADFEPFRSRDRRDQWDQLEKSIARNFAAQ